MFNKEKIFQKLKEAGYEIKHNKNKVTIRNKLGENLVEFIYLENNEKIIMTKDNGYWCIKIDKIEIIYEGFIIHFYDANKKYQQVEIKYML